MGGWSPETKRMRQNAKYQATLGAPVRIAYGVRLKPEAHNSKAHCFFMLEFSLKMLKVNLVLYPVDLSTVEFYVHRSYDYTCI